MDSQQDWRRQRMVGQDSGGTGQRPSGPTGHGGPPRPPATPSAYGGIDDERDVNPPWERESGLFPAVKPAQEATRDPRALWEFESVIERSYPGTSIETIMNTGTGKIPGVVPLRTGKSAWSAGVNVPAAENAAGVPAPSSDVTALVEDVEVDEQPSIQMRALRSGNLARATIIVTSALMLSRVLGLLRTSLFASVFGSKADALNTDAFTNAFALPDMLFTIVAGGALASAFIPVFTNYLVEKRDRKAAWHIASSALNIIMLLLIVFAVLGIIFTREFLTLTLPTIMRNNNSEPETLIQLTRIMLLQPIFLGGATITIAILQARQSFVLPALGQVIYTVSLIAGILATKVDNTTHIFGGHLGIAGPAWGVVAGALLQLFIQVPGLISAKMRYSFSFDIFHPGIREMFRLMAPRLLNAAILYISVFVNRNLLDVVNINGATWGYVTAFTLIMLPNGIFGMAVSQAAFPTLAALVASNEWTRLRDTIMRTVKGIIYLAVPSAFGMMILAEPICQVILGHGDFSLDQLPYFTGPLIYFGIGLVGLSLVEILTRSFYALQDTRTPTQVSIYQFMFSIGLSVVLLGPMGANGLALASSLAWLGEALVLLLMLRLRLAGLDLRGIGVYLVNVLGASVVMALVALLIYRLGELVLPVEATRPNVTAVYIIIRLAVAIIAATGVYFGISRFLGIDDVMPLDRLVRRVFRR
ncbi:MAG TPA: murein biosynthesis integral membrane protein MurJ [Ktedonobacterales bacterium]|nr:murein biosynthesis integral membrane protein MurJ [Ktedonobacterales bacterium]